MLKKHYVLVTRYPHQITTLGSKIKKWHKPTREVINFLGGDSYIDLGEMNLMKSLYVAFRVGMDINKCFLVGKDDVKMMYLNQ